MGEGRTPREIAAALGMAEGTVVWLVGHLVSERGSLETNALAERLARPRVSIARGWVPPFRVAMPAAVVPMAIAALIGLAVLALAGTGTLRGPWIAPVASRAASPTSFASGTPHSDGTQGPATSAPPAPQAAPQPLATATAPAPVSPGAPVTPTSVPPQLLGTPAIPAPVLPSIAPAQTLPSVPAPTLPLLLPRLPTVPPLSTPHL